MYKYFKGDGLIKMACLTLLLTVCAFSAKAQDVIMLKNGQEIKAKVHEITQLEIKYKLFEHLDGPLRTVIKSDVFVVIYENGTREVFSAITTNENVAADVASPNISQSARQDAQVMRYVDPNEFSGFSMGIVGGRVDRNLLLGLNVTYYFNRHHGLGFALHQNRYSYSYTYGSGFYEDEDWRQIFFGPVFHANWWGRSKFYIHTNIGFGVLSNTGTFSGNNQNHYGNYSYNYNNISGAFFFSPGIVFKPVDVFSIGVGMEAAIGINNNNDRIDPNYTRYSYSRNEYVNVFANINFYFGQNNRQSVSTGNNSSGVSQSRTQTTPVRDSPAPATSSERAYRQGNTAIGGNIVIRTGGFTTLGFGAKLQYNIIAPIRLDASFTIFLPHEVEILGETFKTSVWDVSANVHFLFSPTDVVALYPLTGLGFVTRKVEHGLIEDVKVSDVCYNIGGGIDIKLTNQLILNSELKFKYINNDENVTFFSAGLAFKF